MTTTNDPVGVEERGFCRPEGVELRDLDMAKHSPQDAALLRQQASRWLTHAQKDFHDALFARDGSPASLERYASARAELDSAEAWALRVAQALCFLA